MRPCFLCLEYVDVCVAVGRGDRWRTGTPCDEPPSPYDRHNPLYFVCFCASVVCVIFHFLFSCFYGYEKEREKEREDKLALSLNDLVFRSPADHAYLHPSAPYEGRPICAVVERDSERRELYRSCSRLVSGV